jgi:hypothetical protein
MSYLVFINGLGPNYKGEMRYEFIFSEKLEIWGEEWEHEPASTYPKPPELGDIDSVGVLSDGGIELELIQNSDYFSMKDAIDGVISLGWESDKEIEDRLVFRFGEKEEDTKNKLYSKDLILNFEKVL